MPAPYPPNADAGSWDWLNEAHCAYVEGDYQRANVAAILFHAEAVGVTVTYKDLGVGIPPLGFFF